MADRILKFGGPIAVTTDARICRILNLGEGASENRASRGSLYLAGAERVYIGWAEKTVTADTSEEDNKVWLDIAGPVALRIPADVSSFVVKTAANTSTLLYVAD
jgi:hypothetical protein